MSWMRSQNPSWRYALIAFAVIVLAYVVVEVNSRTAELTRLTNEKAGAEQRRNNILATKAVLQTQIAYATSDRAVQDWAYLNGHMVRSGDVPVAPVAVTRVTPIPTSRPTPTPVSGNNLDRWMQLFLGRRTP
jgi:hypothetical protein